ncbi:cell surface protein SprA [Parabacteroides sp. PFB2-12]|uniref:T9SS outer membrane translocon Sov/SprA n=1 Tax=Parabacteroides sp. PFB2-12 TaxID=2940652 RepID=UPI002473A071|nr:cell surface protein SprA [Parabacteroides sp. PFB2-12]MDH6389273.1 cell surface protein SprA [Parabacteroides sp. PFB2-12]
MKKKILKYILWIGLLLFGMGIYAMNFGFRNTELIVPTDLPGELPPDTVVKYPVAKTAPEAYEDVLKQSPADLRDPDNLKTSVEYDIRTGYYLIRTKIGDMDITTPISLTPEEYQDHSLRESIRSYYRQKNEEEFQKQAEKEFNLTDMQFDLGAAEKIFGPGGVRVRTQGSADITMGLKNNTTNNPSLPERSRSRTFFNFDENVQLNVQASVGSKVNFNMNYNTETSFDYDSKKLKLAYRGEEDEIIKNIEAGNVSMTTSNSLIRGGASLFGIKADLQFGKLRVNTLFAQQESESKTVSTKGGVQTKPFELTVDQYDENRHFFLSHYFYDKYDQAMSSLPHISSMININRVEVWVTNKRSNFNQARNIVAFSDLAEHNADHIYNNTYVQPTGASNLPYNKTNNLYDQVNTIDGLRNINSVNQALNGLLEGGIEYEKIESARKLEESEYILNKQLGYISLRTPLQSDEVLAVAFEYIYEGKTYQVGEFSTDNVGGSEENASNTSSTLFVKLLKGTSLSPGMPFWKLMMKNVYYLGAYSIQKDKFKMDILYQSDTTGTYLNYISDGNIRDEILLRVMNLDRLDSQDNPRPDGFFDFLDGYTVDSETGRIFFPSVEPFGSYLRKKIGNDMIADKYVYEELYDSTLTVARQIAEKNKYLLSGEYRASSGAEIQLGATNVARGSVVVTAGGITLSENVDYTVDYTSGIVTILNESILSSNTPVSVRLEDQSAFSMQRKTMLGLDLNYQFSRDFMLGATIMHMSEMPLTVKTTMGNESVKNTLWGLNTSFKKESQWLTNVFDKLPLLELSKPSQISFNAEFAHLIAGHYKNKYSGGYTYLDDFESTQSGANLQNPYSWQLSSTPYQDGENPLFPEASRVNDITYGMNRALLAWYYIDGIMNRSNSTIIRDKDELSKHDVRAIPVAELFPNREQTYSESSILSVLNVAYYPNERGPYNLDADNLNPDGTLMNPEKRWGGMMRRIEQSDFETANFEFIEFWLMDPFLGENEMKEGGDLYFNLGDVSEDILKDEKKFFENGLPIDDDMSKVEETVWGRVPKYQSTGYAFDNTAGAREKQDVGLNGLSSNDEKSFGAYKEYLDKLPMVLSPEVINQMQSDPFSPYNDPAGDNYMYFRDDFYEGKEAGILERYKRFNGTEGNSKEATGTRNQASKTLPDVEDLNQDNNLNENEKYYEYRVSLRKEDLVVGTNYIVDMRDTLVNLPNNTKDRVKWYLFKIPVKKYNRAVGSIRDFKSIRFMRMYMTGFKQPTVLRFGTFELVRSDWRTYEQTLANPSLPPSVQGSLDVSSINIEENGDRQPVNYVLPPGVTRMLDPGQPQLRQENEQALSLQVTNLAPLDARAIYKTTNFDLRQYKRLQLFAHAENFKEIPELSSELRSGDFTVFIRLGSDYKNNYYEYEVPQTITPPGRYYENNSDQLTVWPQENMIDIALDVFTDLKLNRNKARREGKEGVDYHLLYSEYDPNNTRNTISIIGNPTLSEVKTIMIGVRNNTNEIKSGEVWVNELRLTEFNEEGGWAANANLNVAISDLGTVSASGRIETAGFGSLDQSLMERRMDDYMQYSVAANIQLGKFFPEKAKVNIPLYYAISNETIDPKYNPLDQDIELKEALAIVDTKAEKDSIRRFAQDKVTTRSIALNNVKVDIRSKTPMPYDPANFSFGYSFSEQNKRNPETEYETTKDYRGTFAYNYTPYLPPLKPFDKMIKKDNGYTRYLKQLAINYLPSNISFQTAMMRNYYEIQLRDVGNTGMKMDPSFSQNFLWDRAFSIRWNLTNSLNFSFNSGTNARIEEPYVQVNKKLNYDDYQMWKDSVAQSIRDWGTPLKYDQSFQASWTLPLQSIPILDWISANASYSATYNWDRGATLEIDSVEIGNTIRNQRQINGQANLNFQSLYNKSAYLKKVNQRFTPRTASTSSRGRQQQQAPKKKPRVEMEVTLNPDSGTIVKHNMMENRVRITARTLDGKSYPIKAKGLNFAEAIIHTKDTVKLKIVIQPAAKDFSGVMTDVAQYSARFLMMLRRMNISYTQTDGMTITGFRPEIGNIFGQRRGGAMAPGLGFAFGDVRRSFIDDAYNRGWLVTENNVNPAIINLTTSLDLRANLEPIAGLKIDLNANRTTSENTQVQYMYDGMPEIRGGNFTMTTISLRSTFKRGGSASDNYKSEAFNDFLNNRDIIRNRVQQQYIGKKYPTTGFLEGTPYAGTDFQPDLEGGVYRNSADVLIPAFIAAYTGKDAKKVSLSPFPSLSNLLPNWSITYDGLVQIPFFKKHFKSFVLSHRYRSIYSIGSYTSSLNWVSAGGDLGFISSTQSDNPIPSSPYEMSSVSISESFNPLFGADATLVSNMTGRMAYNTSSTLSLNVSSYQIVESLNDELIVGIGYKITEFNKVLKRKASQNFSNDLDIRFDYSYRKTQSLIRKIEENLTQATSGNVTQTLMFSLDYALSRALSLRAFYDLQINKPLISSASFPTSNSNFGISIRFSLTQ